MGAGAGFQRMQAAGQRKPALCREQLFAENNIAVSTSGYVAAVGRDHFRLMHIWLGCLVAGAASPLDKRTCCSLRRAGRAKVVAIEAVKDALR